MGLPSALKARGHISRVTYVLIAAFVIRAFVPILAAAVTGDPQVFRAPDTASYTSLAGELAATGSFALGGKPEIVRTPGYPLFLVPGAVLGLFEWVAIPLQIILSCLTVWLVYRTALLLFEKTGIAEAAALLYAFEPLSVIYASKLLTETLFTCLVAAFLYTLLRYQKGGGLRWVLVSAAALAASVYVRPISYFLPFLVGAGLIVRALLHKPKHLRRGLVHACVFLAVCAAPIVAWQGRNAALTGYKGFSAISDVNLYFYQGASVTAAKRCSSYYALRKELGYGDDKVYFNKHPDQSSWSEAERYRFMRSAGLQVIRAHPLIYLKVHLKGMTRAFFDPAAFDYLKIFKLYPHSGGLLGVVMDRGVTATVVQLFRTMPLVFWSNVVLGLVLGAYLLFGLAGLLSKILRKNTAAAVILFVAFYFILLSGGAQAEARFRHPIMPIVCILAGLGLSLVAGRFRKERPGQACPPACSMGNAEKGEHAE